MRIILILLIFCFGCQTGRIPCPKFKAKSVHHKRFKNNTASLSARAEVKDPEPEFKARKMPDNRVVKNVSVEEWDCPQPGTKKYLPRSVKENIRNNARRMQDHAPILPADSTLVE